MTFLQFGVPLPASTLRGQTWTVPELPVSDATVLATLTVRAFLINGISTPLVPMDPQDLPDTMTLDRVWLAQVLCDWPAVFVGQNPVQPNDTLVLGGARYRVHSVESYPGLYLRLAVEVPTDS